MRVLLLDFYLKIQLEQTTNFHLETLQDMY